MHEILVNAKRKKIPVLVVLKSGREEEGWVVSVTKDEVGLRRVDGRRRTTVLIEEIAEVFEKSGDIATY